MYAKDKAWIVRDLSSALNGVTRAAAVARDGFACEPLACAITAAEAAIREARRLAEIETEEDTPC